MKKAVVSLIIRGRDLTGKAFKGLKKKLAGLTSSIFSMRTAIAGLATGVIAKGIVSLFKLGSAAEETSSKFRTVFGAASAEVQKFNDTFGLMAGLSRTQAQEVTATTGAIAQGFGFAQKESAAFAMEIVKLGADLASFNDLQGGTAQGIEIIRTGLTGEMERLKRLGIVVRATEVDERALIMTGKDNASQLIEKERAMARFALITEKAGVAVDDLTRTQTSMANVSRRLGGTLRTVREDMGTMFLEAFKLTGGFTDSAAGAKTFSDKLQENRNQIVAWVAAAISIAKALGSSFKTGFVIVKNFVDVGLNLIKVFIELVTSSFTNLGLIIQAVWRRDFAAVGRLGGAMGDEFDAAFRNIKNSVINNAGDIQRQANRTTDAIQEMVDSVKRAVQESKGIDTGIGTEVGRVTGGVSGFAAPRVVDPAVAQAKHMKQLAADIEETIDTTERLTAQFKLGIITTEEFGLGILRFSRAMTQFKRTGELTDDQLIELTATMQELQKVARETEDLRLAGLEQNLPILEQVGLVLKRMFIDAQALNEILANIGTNFLQDFGSAIESAFKAWVTGSQSAASAFKSAMLDAISSVARATAQLFLGKAAGALAEGLLGNPAAFAAAAKFTGAAAVLFALAGTLGGVASGGGGGAAGPGVGSDSEQADRLQDREGDMTIIFQGGRFLDMGDPRQEELFIKALEELTGRRQIVVIDQ